MFLCQPLLEVLAGRGFEDIDAFLKVPSWHDLPDPFSISSTEKAAARVLSAVLRRERITIHGDYPLHEHIVRQQPRSIESHVSGTARTASIFAMRFSIEGLHEGVGRSSWISSSKSRSSATSAPNFSRRRSPFSGRIWRRLAA